MRSDELQLETTAEGGQASTDAGKGVWDALLARTIRFVLLSELDPLPALQTRSQTCNSFTYTAEHGIEGGIVRVGVVLCGVSGLE